MDSVVPADAIIDDLGRGIIYKVKVSRSKEGKSATSLENISIRENLVSCIKVTFRFLFGDGPRNMWYGWNLFRMMYRHGQKLRDYDMVIAISYPFPVLFATRLVALLYPGHAVLVADCGDPLYRNPSFSKAHYLKYLERWVLGGFHYITIPFEDAKDAYCGIVPSKKIKIIPQGMCLLEVDDRLYQPNDVPTFCYAGVFYKQIRNPKFFFEYLLTLVPQFRFVVYCLDDPFSQGLLSFYKKPLGDKLVIESPVDREILIKEMAKMDFVINFDNDNATQRPSKLVDYAMSHRPILSFNRETFRPEVFQAFLKGDYREQYNVDLEQYDIRRVVDQFEALFEEKIGKEVQ